jgi:hypothetical protein
MQPLTEAVNDSAGPRVFAAFYHEHPECGEVTWTLTDRDPECQRCDRTDGTLRKVWIER